MLDLAVGRHLCSKWSSNHYTNFLDKEELRHRNCRPSVRANAGDDLRLTRAILPQSVPKLLVLEKPKSSRPTLFPRNHSPKRLWHIGGKDLFRTFVANSPTLVARKECQPTSRACRRLPNCTHLPATPYQCRCRTRELSRPQRNDPRWVRTHREAASGRTTRISLRWWLFSFL